ncbi:MAG: hypothetical protein AAF696_23260, partial [Bacteroidota bacterium]
MQTYIRIFIGLFAFLFVSEMEAQINRVNFSIQAGYHFNILNPRPYNLAFDIFNNNRTDVSKAFETVRYTGGYTAGFAIHRRRSDIRLQLMTFQQRSDAAFTSALNGPQIVDTKLSGQIISFQLISKLIPLGRAGDFMIGAGLNATHLESKADVFDAASFSEDSDLTQRTNDWKAGFMIVAPFRFEITELINISVEPYFQVYFGTTDFVSFSEAINTAANSTDPLLIRQIDHPG